MLAEDSRCFRGPGGFRLQFNSESSCLKINFRHHDIGNGVFFFTWLARNTNGATPTGRCLRTKTDRHPVESKTLCDFHLKPQHPSAAQERWEKVEEAEQEDKNKRLIEGKIVLSQKA